MSELLLTAAILAYALSVMLTTFANNSQLNESNRNLTTATTHAEYILESIKNLAFSNIAADINAGTWTWSTATITANGLSALNSEDITSTVSGANPLDITVAVNWHDAKGRVRSKSLRTLISG